MKFSPEKTLELMVEKFGSESVGHAAEAVCLYMDSFAKKNLEVYITSEFLTVAPQGSADVRKNAEFVIHVPSGHIVVDEAGMFGNQINVQTAKFRFAPNALCKDVYSRVAS